MTTKLDNTLAHQAAEELRDIANRLDGANDAPRKREDGVDTKLIAGHFPKATWRQFHNLCTASERTAQQLLEEALTDLFIKYGYPEIAPVKGRRS